MRTYQSLGTLICLPAAMLLLTAPPALPQSAAKPTTVQEVFYVAPQSMTDLWDNSAVVVKVKIHDSAATLIRDDVYTEFRADVLRVFKGTAGVGSAITFVQSGGVVETPERVVRNDAAPLMRPGRTYVVFLKQRPEDPRLLVTYNAFGAFEVDHARIQPLAGGDVGLEHKGMAESRFVIELDRLRLLREGARK